MIISSTYLAGNPQADGRRIVSESHTADDGMVYTYSFLAEPTTNVELVLSERAAVLNAQLAAKAEAEALVYGTKLPLSTYEFLARMMPQERIGIRTAAKSDVIIEDLMNLLDNALVVHPLNPDVQNGLGYLVSKSLLTFDRAAVIGAA